MDSRRGSHDEFTDNHHSRGNLWRLECCWSAGYYRSEGARVVSQREQCSRSRYRLRCRRCYRVGAAGGRVCAAGLSIEKFGEPTASNELAHAQPLVADTLAAPPFLHIRVRKPG